MKHKYKLTNWNYDLVTIGRYRTIFYRWDNTRLRCLVKIEMISYDDGTYLAKTFIKKEGKWIIQFEIKDNDLDSIKLSVDVFLLSRNFYVELLPKNYI